MAFTNTHLERRSRTSGAAGPVDETSTPYATDAVVVRDDTTSCVGLPISRASVRARGGATRPAAVRRESEKSTAKFASEASGRPIAWRDVLGCLDAYRAAGFSPDDFAASRAARATMAEALVRIEDWLELEPQSSWVARERRAIRSVRRRLERELWP